MATATGAEMRDPNRIDPMIERLRQVWKANPDLRLAQLICNATSLDDPYYIEDDELQKRLMQMPGAAPTAQTATDWCNCGAKTPQPQYHAFDCPARK